MKVKRAVKVLPLRPTVLLVVLVHTVMKIAYAQNALLERFRTKRAQHSAKHAMLADMGTIQLPKAAKIANMGSTRMKNKKQLANPALLVCTRIPKEILHANTVSLVDIVSLRVQLLVRCVFLMSKIIS